MEKEKFNIGVIHAGFSYFIWGLLPIYWKLLGVIGADEVLAHRVLWSFVFMVFVLLFTKKVKAFLDAFREIKKNKSKVIHIIIASVLISINWFLYIWAVNSNQMVEVSLGYYINPLVSVLLGMIFLKERLIGIQYLSFILASIGVLIISFSYGRFPWIAMVLAVSFGLYGLAKKMTKMDSTIGLTFETMVMTPIAFIYICSLFIKGIHSFMSVSLVNDFLLMGAGVATALPLLYFAKGAQRIPLSVLGFLQYIAPTLMLFLGVLFYGEHFTEAHFISFLFIWTALTVYSLSMTKWYNSLEAKWKKSKEFGAKT